MRGISLRNFFFFQDQECHHRAVTLRTPIWCDVQLYRARFMQMKYRGARDELRVSETEECLGWKYIVCRLAGYPFEYTSHSGSPDILWDSRIILHRLISEENTATAESSPLFSDQRDHSQVKFPQGKQGKRLNKEEKYMHQLMSFLSGSRSVKIVKLTVTKVKTFGKLRGFFSPKGENWLEIGRGIYHREEQPIVSGAQTPYLKFPWRRSIRYIHVVYICAAHRGILQQNSLHAARKVEKNHSTLWPVVK